MKKLLLLSILGVSLFSGDVAIEDIIQSMEQNQQEHKANQLLTQAELNKAIETNYKFYEDVFKQSMNYYQTFIGQKWGKDDIKLSSKTTFTQYDNDLNSRETIDFENGEVVLEVLDDDLLSNVKEFQKRFNKLTNQTVEESFINDPVNKVAMDLINEKNILKDKLPKNKNIILDKNLLQTTKIKKEDIKHKIVDTKEGKKKISYVVIKMVPKHLQIKAKRFKDTVHKNSKRFNIQDSLVFGIMQTESYFNPLARSHIPAFGLMQIVPSSAGKDAYYSLYKKRKILSPKYLYNTKNNIEIGTKYIQIIQENYLKGITDPKKLFYCTATSYNAGIGSLCRSITGKRITKTNFSKIRNEAIEKINQMSTKALYKHLTTSKKLTIEAQNYVVKVEKNSKDYLSWDR